MDETAMTEKTYEGFSNYETWTVRLWITRTGYFYEYWQKQALKHWLAAALSNGGREGKGTRHDIAGRDLVQQLKNEIPDSFPVKPSVCAGCPHAGHDEVHWNELAEYLLTDALEPREPTDDLLGPGISSYATRASAIEDSFLIDVSKMAKEEGIEHPTAITRAVWDEFVETREGVETQDERDRLWDLLTMFHFAAQQSPQGTELLFHVLVPKDSQSPKLVALKAICGPGDTPEPVLTIMFPDED